MKIRDAVLLGTLALAGCSTDSTPADVKDPVQKEEQIDLEKLVAESKDLWKRNKPGKLNVTSDHEQAIRIFEKVARNVPTPENVEALMKMREEEGIIDFNTAQALLNYRFLNGTNKKTLKDTYGIETAEQAGEYAKQMYRVVLEFLEPVAKAKPDREKVWIVIGTSHSRFKEWDEAIVAYRALIALQPKEPNGYKSMFSAYAGKKKTGDLLAELDNIKGMTGDEKLLMLAKGINELYAEFRKTNLRAGVEALSKEDKLSAAKMFYATARAYWKEEMKKEKASDRNFVYPAYACFVAGGFEIIAAESDSEKNTACKTLEKEYNSINNNFENALGRLDAAFQRIVLNNKSVHVEDSEKVHAILKSFYAKKEF